MAKVYGIHEIGMRPGADQAEFEKFVAEEVLPAWPVPDIGFRLLKGDRGDREGRYLVLYEFPSVEVRNRYFPTPGVASDEFRRAFEAGAAVWEKWRTFASALSSPLSTDYVEIAGKSERDEFLRESSK